MTELDKSSTSLHVIQIVQVYLAYLTVQVILITAIREWERNRQTIFGAARKEAGRVENRVRGLSMPKKALWDGRLTSRTPPREDRSPR